MDESAEYYQIVKEAFRKLAPFYNLLILPASKLRVQVASLIPLDKGARILDVATGTGAQAFAFARYGFEVTAIDQSEAMFVVAKRHNQAHQVKFVLGDATQLPWLDACFDVCSISFALHDMPLSIRKQVLNEMIRLTKSGGMIVIVDYALPEGRIGRWLTYHLTKLYEGQYYVKFIQSDLNTLLRQVGIRVDRQIPALFGSARILIGTPIAQTEASVTLPTLSAVS